MWALPLPDPARCGLCTTPGVTGVFAGREFVGITSWRRGDIILTVACHPTVSLAGGVAVGRSLVAGPRPVCAACQVFIEAADFDALVRHVVARLLQGAAEQGKEARLSEQQQAVVDGQLVPSVEAGVRLVVAHRRSAAD